MRNAFLVASCLALIPLALAACGGTSSETPWPVEPVTTNEPPGEPLPGDTSERPDAGAPSSRPLTPL